ncbi:hypothetical protein ACHHYP_07547 [Achlya hypogyna]|uniref:WLM domain-containing protein n=1 Tax=Achlya hypogyna TaxID=1202772 RepID=A0A1V9YQV1_ACHHY|nr:hypothetical protein ACHHYP_07547 [Achlya hypogyna]
MLRVKYQDAAVSVPLPPEGAAVGAVKAALEAQLHVPATEQRLIAKGKVLDDAARLAAGQTAVLLVRPSADALAAMAAQETAIQQADTARAARPVISIHERNAALSARAHAALSYRFEAIAPLPGLPDEAKARAILTSLAQDKGILHVMAQHKWRVGSLAEMFPDGKVGVDPVCVLGLNENKGQRILLRLRTDDLRGFRKYLTIKKVLFHELAHNEVSDHNNDFYKLMRQVEAECTAVPGTTTALPLTNDAPDGSPGFGHVLGGAADATDARELRAQRALDRLQAQPPTGAPAAAPAASPTTVPAMTPMATSAPPAESSATPTSKGKVPLAASLEPEPREAEIAVLPTIEIDAGVFATMGERERRVVEAAQKLRGQLNAESDERRQGVLVTLHVVLSNVLQAPGNPLFRRLRKANGRLAKNVMALPLAVLFLEHVGFTDELPDRTHLVLARDDPGLVWLGKSVLDRLLDN